MPETKGIFITERQRLFLWVVVAICLILGVAVTLCLVTYAALDTGASLELRVQVQELRGAVAELAGRLDNASLDIASSVSALTAAVDALAPQQDNNTRIVEDLAAKAASTIKALEELSKETGDSTAAVSRMETQYTELTARLDKISDSLSSEVATLSSALDGLRAVVSNSSSLSLPSCRLFRMLGLPSGVFSIDPQDDQPAFPAFCDMDTAGGPWLVFQRRKDGSVNFTRNWADYESGFGDPDKEFWLGLEKLHRLTSTGLTQLRVDMATWEGRTGYALYSTFQVASSSDHFRLEVHGYSGNAGDDMYYNNNANFTANGMQFSTYDQDHDTASNSCAQLYKAGWWYNSCHNAHPNGIYGSQGSEGGQYVKWASFYDNTKKSLKFMEMKIK